ncbi:hypothetical protein NQ314_001246 [Rhamnusium bicolor]|uniref:Uncharacterized protein n=1 Tax=Rhamnusium bicolor TaxID=1586634 RepID=A0AAV8ZVI5_9CUCU|nr:hypothetical protein NQ314_001246 [Rhamnusium bicolor]
MDYKKEQAIFKCTRKHFKCTSIAQCHLQSTSFLLDTRSFWKQNKILSDWKMLSTNRDNNNLEFISSMESISYQYMEFSFTGEESSLNLRKVEFRLHEAVYVSQYFANFFVNECRKNKNTFPSLKLEKIP